MDTDTDTDSPKGEAPLKRIIRVLEGAVSSVQTVLTAMGEKEDNRYYQAAVRDAADLELSSSSEDEEPRMDMRTRVKLDAKAISKEQRRAKRKENWRRAEAKAATENTRTFARSDFPRILKMLISLTPEMNSSDELRKFWCEDKRNEIKAGIKEEGIKVTDGHKPTVTALVGRVLLIFRHLDANVFCQPKLNLSELTVKDKLKIMQRYYKNTPDEGCPGAPLKIKSASILPIVVRHQRKKNPSWQPNKYIQQYLDD